MSIKLIKDVTNGIPLVPTQLSIVQKMVTEYSGKLRTMGASLMGMGAQKQSSSVWVSWAELQQFVSENNANGIRIYFGQHVDESVGGTPEYKGMLTVILVSTKDAANPVNAQFDTSVDQLTESHIAANANSIAVAGPFTGQADDQFPICNPKCPGTQNMKINIQ